MSNFAGICLLGLLLASITATESQSAPSPAPDCTSLVLNMADCLSFVTSGSTVQNPEGTCCDGLKKVLNTDAECLCEVLKSSAQLGITLNVSKALSLPAVCRVSTPSFSQCGPLSPVGSVLAPSPSVPPPPAPGTSGFPVVSASFGIMAIAIACLAMF